MRGYCPFPPRAPYTTVKRATENVQLVLQHCCKTSWIAMFRCFATCVQTCFATNKVVRVFFVGDKRRKIAIQLVLQQSRKTSCTFSVARSWKSIAILVGSIIYGEIPFLEHEKKNCRYGSFTFYTAISKKVLGKTVHTTIPKGIMGYDQCTFRDTVAVESTFVAFL